jgi:hypothetical protein
MTLAWNRKQKGIYSNLFDLVKLEKGGWVFRWRP